MHGTGTLRIGISGWRYEPWRGVFYPDKLPQKDELAYASRRLSSIEINGSFYSMQRPEYYARWRDETPDAFVFALKGPRYITHVRKLDDVGPALANLFASGLAELRGKLGPILWQLSPTLRFDADLIEGFAARLPRDTDAAAALAARHTDKVAGRTALDYGAKRPLRHAFEVRNHSFADPAFVDIARRHGIAIVVGDTTDADGGAGKWPRIEDVTADFVYLRLHGLEEQYPEGYTAAALERWAGRIRDWQDGGQPSDARLVVCGSAPAREPRDVYCYFDNDQKALAPRDAQSLARILGVSPPA
jgi:uncharacterized protein YecE (DUF72 family)